MAKATRPWTSLDAPQPVKRAPSHTTPRQAEASYERAYAQAMRIAVAIGAMKETHEALQALRAQSDRALTTQQRLSLLEAHTNSLLRCVEDFYLVAAEAVTARSLESHRPPF